MAKRNMTDEERKAYNEYHKKWYHAHREQVRARSKELYQQNIEENHKKQKAYYDKNAKKICQWQHDYRKEHSDVVRQTDHNKYERNKEEILRKNALRYEANKESILARDKLYREKHAHDIAICEACGCEFEKDNYHSCLCADCIARRHETLHDVDSTYKRTWAGGKQLIDHREILKQVGLLTPEIEQEGYVVHHIDGVKDNNDVDNLMLIKPQDHARLHRLLESEWIKHPDMNMEELTELVIHSRHFDFI